jgi:hypothetical protein
MLLCSIRDASNTDDLQYMLAQSFKTALVIIY